MATPQLKATTFEYQDKLPKLPIPPLQDTLNRYLKALEGIQSEEEHQQTKIAVEKFLQGEGPKWQEKLLRYAADKDSYIEEFWYESYLSHSDPVVLSLNPFFVLEDDPISSHGSQLHRAASLIASSLGFVHDLRAGVLHPDSVRGTPLDMYQYTRLFGTARIPTERGCKMVSNEHSQHIVIIRRGQCYYFDVLDSSNRPLLTDSGILANLRAIVADADRTPPSEVARGAIGLLSTENRKVWSNLRKELQSDVNNKRCLRIMDDALFVVCLDDAAPEDVGMLCSNFLCGTYGLDNGVQVGTCTNRWYDKLQIIVCENGAAGINFEHTGVDGHTVLRFAADVYTDALMLLARSINPSAPKMFTATLSPHSKYYKPPKHNHPQVNGAGTGKTATAHYEHIDTAPRKLEWTLSASLRTGIRFAETRLSDLICQNDCQALEFRFYGKNFITRYGFSPDAFVQMAFQAAYYGLYGRIECTYEPAMTKMFLHGRTEAIRSVQPESVNFTKTFFSEVSSSKKIAALRKACEAHVRLTKECSKGLGQDRHLYAIYCLIQREQENKKVNGGANPLPDIFTDGGWSVLNTSILSTSNCGNPALRLFGFGPVAQDGFGIGYIIRDDGISICASSKHLQTRRFLDTIQAFLIDVQKMVVSIYREANERPAPFVDHAGVLRDSKTGMPIMNVNANDEEEETAVEDSELTGYSFFDSGTVDALNRPRMRLHHGKVLHIAEY